MHSFREKFDDRFLTREEVAEFLSISVRTLSRWAKKRVGPPCTLVGRLPRYSLRGLQEWVESCTVHFPQRGVAIKINRTPPNVLYTLATPTEAAGYLNVSRRTLLNWSCGVKFGPPAIKFSKFTRYRSLDIRRWLESQAQGTTEVASEAVAHEKQQ